MAVWLAWVMAMGQSRMGVGLRVAGCDRFPALPLLVRLERDLFCGLGLMFEVLIVLGVLRNVINKILEMQLGGVMGDFFVIVNKWGYGGSAPLDLVQAGKDIAISQLRDGSHEYFYKEITYRTSACYFIHKYDIFGTPLSKIRR